MDYAGLVELLKEHGVHFAAGLTDAELTAAEEFYDIRFPKALREFYSVGLPVSSDPPGEFFSRDDWFPIWNDFSDENTAAIRERMEYPVQSVLWDDESLAERLNDAPKMIPVHAHRYVPQMENCDDPPVLSVHGRDILCYGADLTDFLYHEFLRDLPREPKEAAAVPVWSGIGWN